MFKKILLTFAVFSSITCHAIMKIGHRGACGYEPENTLRSFAKAAACGVDMVELDVHVCKSGELVVFHDPKLSDGSRITDKTLTELMAYDMGKGERIPTLEQVFEMVLPTSVIINIELKGKGTALLVADLIDKYMQKGYAPARFLVTSFDHYALIQFRSRCPGISVGAILEGLPIGLADFGQRAEADYVVVSFEFLTQEFVDHAHAHDIKVLVYTVNDYDDIAVVKELGVDGIISNFPDRI